MPERYPTCYVPSQVTFDDLCIISQDSFEAFRAYDLDAVADEIQQMIDAIQAKSLSELMSDSGYAQIADHSSEIVAECPLLGAKVNCEGLWHSFIPSTADYTNPRTNAVKAWGYFTGIVTALAIGEYRNYDTEKTEIGLMVLTETEALVENQQTTVRGVICSPIKSTRFEFYFPSLN